MGKVLIIKGADFSENAVNKAFKKTNELIYDSDGEGDYQVYEGSPSPIPHANGMYIYTSRWPIYSHHASCLVTDKIAIEDFTRFKVHSIFKLSGDAPIGAILFADANDSVVGFYTLVVPDTPSSKYLGTVPTTTNWCDVEGDIPSNATHIVAACYMYGTNETYEDFELVLY